MDSKDYRNKLLAQQKTFPKRLRKVTDPAIDQAVKIKNTRGMDKVIVTFAANLKQLTETEIKKAWMLSTRKNNDQFSEYLKDLRTTGGTEFLNEEALKAFLSRKVEGEGYLSSRVWDVSKKFREEINLHIAFGVANGQSADQIAANVKRYLNNPDDLFRRLRRGDKLVPSKPMKAYHPGRGVYRSAYKNAIRLARTEVNRAYLLADHLRWLKDPAVIGINIALSDQHPDYPKPEICEINAGDYPKEFLFIGWHPQCLCHATPILMKRDDFRAWLRGEKPFEAKQITELPTGYQQTNVEAVTMDEIAPDINAQIESIKTLADAKRVGGLMGLVMDTKVTNPETLKMVFGRIKAIQSEFALPIKGFVSKPPIGLEEALAGFPETEVYLNPKLFKSDASVLKYLDDNGQEMWFGVRGRSTESPMKAIIDHEFGHGVTLAALDNKRSGFYKEIKKIYDRYNLEESQVIASRYGYYKGNIVSGYTPPKLTMTKAQIKDWPIKNKISEYGSVVIGEFVAEAFSMTLNSPAPSPYAIEVMELIKKYFGVKN